MTSAAAAAAAVDCGGSGDDIAAAFNACEARRIASDGRLIKYTHCALARSFPDRANWSKCTTIIIVEYCARALACVRASGACSAIIICI